MLAMLAAGVTAVGLTAAVALLMPVAPQAEGRELAAESTAPPPALPNAARNLAPPAPPGEPPAAGNAAAPSAVPFASRSTPALPARPAFVVSRGTSYRDLKQGLVKTVQPLTVDVSKPLGQEMRTAILRWALLELQGEASYNRVLGTKRGAAFYTDLMNSPALLDTILCSGDIPSPQRLVEALYILHGDDREGILHDPVLRNLAAAIAVWGNDRYAAHEHYLFWKNCWQQGLLHKEFGQYSALEMRFVLAKTNPETAASMQRYHNLPMSEIGNIAWVVPYQGQNIYGFDPLTGPWEHRWGWPAMARDSGGVCGTVSYYGSAGINARGLMSTPGEQPGHCAYEYRRLDGTWVIGNYVARPTGTHTRVLPLGNFMAFEYIDDMFADADAQNRAQELEYLAWMVSRKLDPPVETLVDSCEVFLLEPVAPFHLDDKSPVRILAADTPISLDAAPRNDNFALRWTGRLRVSDERPRTFRVACDDSLSLTIDGERLISLDTVGSREVTRTLTPGEHEFALVFGQLGGAKRLTFEITNPPQGFQERIAEIHQAALQACPLHFNAIRAWGDQIAAAPGPDTSRMDRWVDHVLGTMGDHPENAWLFVKDLAVPCVKQIGGNEAVLALYQKAHASLHDIPARFWHPVDMQFDQLLNQMAATLDNNKADVFRLFEVGLEGQRDAPGCFGDLLKWGGGRFLSDPAYADQYTSAITATFLKRGDVEGLKGFILNQTRQAQITEDVASFRAASAMRDQLEPPQLTPLQPKFSSALLSADGLFRMEKYHDSFPCTEHDRVIQEVEEGRARTSYGPAWGKVVLAGDCMIDGIYIRGSEHTSWQVPFTVQVSADGKAWQQVFATDKPGREWTVDLSKEPVHGRFVKIERATGPNHFELEKVLVYGKRLY